MPKRIDPVGIVLLALAWLISSGVSFGQDKDESFQAGAAAIDITPTKWPISVNGGMKDIQATSAHDPLHARCIVLKNSETSLAIVVVDSCMIPRELMDQAKTTAALTTGIPRSNILISATHAHSCPTVTPIFQSEPNEEYSLFLTEKITEAIEKAKGQLEPAKVGWGSVQQPSLLFNRRWYVKSDEDRKQTVANPFGVMADRVITNPGFANPRVQSSVNLIDSQLSYLSIQALDGRPISLLANYSLHYIGGVPANTVSADYFGEFAQRLAHKLNAADVQPPFVGIMSNGTSGDVNNVDFRQKSPVQREPFEQIVYAAELLSQDIARAYPKIQYHESGPLDVVQQEIVVGVRKPVDAEVKAAQEKLDGAGTAGPYDDRDLIYARETTLLAEYKTSTKIKLQAIRIGDLAIATTPCETFAETGKAIRAASTFKTTFTISLANGYNGYLPPPEQHLLGGYETWRARSSYLSVDSEPKILSTLKKMLRDLSK